MDGADQSCGADRDRSDPSPIPSPQGGGEELPAGAEDGGGAEAGEKREIAWGEIRRVYELTNTPTIEILRRYGLTESQLRWRRTSEKWEPRPPAAVQRAKADSPERLKARMLSLYAVLVSRFENWIAKAEEFEAAQASALAVLAAGFGHLTRSDEREDFWMARHTGKSRTATAPREKKNNDAGYDFRDDPAWLDAEINRRLDRLFDKKGVGGGPRRDEAGGEAGASGELAMQAERMGGAG